jgi:hypothetical protein
MKKYLRKGDTFYRIKEIDPKRFKLFFHLGDRFILEIVKPGFYRAIAGTTIKECWDNRKQFLVNLKMKS